ncbi:MAG: hypothetical protein PHN56_00840 [Candidatus Nanoarchaeia archaeon]|nr:hypothetical protein [Candidatus Nanoarchaeia archaeon]
MYNESVELFSKAYDLTIKSNIKPSIELTNACDYLNLKKGFSQKITKSTLIITLLFIIPSIVLFCFFNNFLILFIPIIINHFYSEYYKSKYHIELIKDLGYLPDFFSLLITNLKINPNLESAFLNSSNFDYGMSSRISKKIIQKINSGVDINTKEEFSKEFRIFSNSKIDLCVNSLISAISVKNQIKRNILFSDSLNQLLDFMKNNAELFSRKIYTSVLMIFGIGTVIPLILVSIFPLIGLISGTSLDTYSLLFFLILSLFFVSFIISDLKKKSPSKFSQISVNSKIKGINPLLIFLIILALSSSSIILLFEELLNFKTYIFLREYSPYFFYASASIVLSFNYYFKNKMLVKEKRVIQKIEDSLIDSFMVIGSRINEGHSIESSIKYAKDNSENDLKDFFSKVYNKISKLGIELQKAFDFSMISANVFSKRIKSMIDLLCFTVKKHSLSAGEAMIDMCNYYRKIKGVEFDMDNSLSKNTDMIKMTILFFSPIVCALIINISGVINTFVGGQETMIFFTFNGLNIELLGLLISGYLLIFVFVLSDFYSFLKFGEDKIEAEFDLSKSLIIAFLMFTATLIISKVFLFKL